LSVKVRIFVIIIFICNNITSQNVKIFGHRGCRGLMPENTISSFQKAIELGADGIEWDVVVNKNHELIISHEPYIDVNYCTRIDKTEILNNSPNYLNIYKMSTAQVKEYDCGSLYQKEFPNQTLYSSTKPTVKECLDVLETLNPLILFEIKSAEDNYGEYQPHPKIYAKIIFNELSNYKNLNNIYFMSFDSNILNELNKLMPGQKYIYLSYNPLSSIVDCLNDLNFKPFALGLYYQLISTEAIELSHKKKIELYAWTVNDVDMGNKLIQMGIDGLISDYPNYFIK